MQSAQSLDFKPFSALEAHSENSHYFLFFKNKIICKKTDDNDEVSPLLSSADVKKFSPLHEVPVGTLGGNPLTVGELSAHAEEMEEGYELVHLRALFDVLPPAMLMTCGYASHLLHWSLRHRLCGYCGTALHNRAGEKAKQCPNCQQVYYPEINPAIIVAIVKDGQLLLAHSARFKKKFYSVLAGFVEMGEDFETTVRREVMEEVGIKVKNIQYFGSQPWPFPSSLMIGFTAEWASGEITLQDDEIDDAGWYTPENMPPIPSSVSIAGKLIKWYLEKYPRK